MYKYKYIIEKDGKNYCDIKRCDHLDDRINRISITLS